MQPAGFETVLAKGAGVGTPGVLESRLGFPGRRCRSRGEHEPQADPSWEIKWVKPRALLTHKSKENSQWGCHQDQPGHPPKGNEEDYRTSTEINLHKEADPFP